MSYTFYICCIGIVVTYVRKSSIREPFIIPHHCFVTFLISVTTYWHMPSIYRGLDATSGGLFSHLQAARLSGAARSHAQPCLPSRTAWTLDGLANLAYRATPICRQLAGDAAVFDAVLQHNTESCRGCNSHHDRSTPSTEAPAFTTSRGCRRAARSNQAVPKADLRLPRQEAADAQQEAIKLCRRPTAHQHSAVKFHPMTPTPCTLLISNYVPSCVSYDLLR
ncbi:hypothetical protein BS78_K095200 [Paspalum vaginatum]|uniref:Uncharacterized protein n=1 Tax=Paspalum vaginatum TaxID=158149 RepID=A0A9W7XBR9_9POAL|nr:hypothetical protein BS78_K095200 [Paspalum vaginatum]